MATNPTQRTITAFIPCIPPMSTAQGSSQIMKRKNGQRFVGKSSNSKAKATQNQLWSMLELHRPDTPYSTPVKLSTVWVWPWRKNEPKKNRVDGLKWKDTKPDVDNMLKIMLDVMTRLGYWADDNVVQLGHVYRFWGERPGIHIQITDQLGSLTGLQLAMTVGAI